MNKQIIISLLLITNITTYGMYSNKITPKQQLLNACNDLYKVKHENKNNRIRMLDTWIANNQAHKQWLNQSEFTPSPLFVIHQQQYNPTTKTLVLTNTKSKL